MRPRLLLILCVCVVLCGIAASCSLQREFDRGSLTAIKCEYTFFNTEPEDVDRIARVLEKYRLAENSLYMSVGADTIYCEFTVAMTDDLDRIHGDLRNLPQLRSFDPALRNSASSTDRLRPAVVFAQINPVFTTGYRTAQLEGGLTMALRFSISPGATLFYAADGDEEVAVPDSCIAVDGTVFFPTSVREGQRYVYGRTVLGDVTKCIRIQVFTGHTEEIPLEEYRRHVAMRRGGS